MTDPVSPDSSDPDTQGAETESDLASAMRMAVERKLGGAPGGKQGQTPGIEPVRADSMRRRGRGDTPGRGQPAAQRRTGRRGQR